MINDNEKVLNLNEIETQIKFLSEYRGEERKQRLKTTSLNLHRTLKSFGYINVDKKFLMTFFDGLKRGTNQNIFNEVLNFLVEDNKIKPSTKNKIRVRIREKPLFSYMDKNGSCITSSKLSNVKMRDVYKIKSYIFI